ncbi:Transposase DDE domain protein [Psychrobacter piechaudii]|uniref:Transposase DDE domain protein n=2 Tax=Psychrobacter TaxID=497 RepID=A0A1R4GWS0_9GAMM|nr:Transposase DDE domain protein [Psychrobacter pasteurii]SJM72628.1 Transposase DDE domain protein [Psychrobacter piechaudii]
MGNLLSIVVHAANIHDTKSGKLAIEKLLSVYTTIKAVSADAGYRRTFEEQMMQDFKLPVDISTKIAGSWQIIPKRWVVERTFAWLNNSRRLAKDFEVTVTSAENFVKLAHIHLILRTL